jgi:hypothetical protein
MAVDRAEQLHKLTDELPSQIFERLLVLLRCSILAQDHLLEQLNA